MPILAANNWKSNADLILDLVSLGYLASDQLILDATWGKGLWWKYWTPDRLIGGDLDEGKAKDFVADFRELPFPHSVFDAVAYDPPYVSVGGSKTTSIGDMYDRFGLTDAPKTPAGLQELMNYGLSEMFRVVKPKGLVFMKCQDYVSSGKLWPGVFLSLKHAYGLGFVLFDRFEHISGIKAQPPNRRQVHARRNHSSLLILKKSLIMSI